VLLTFCWVLNVLFVQVLQSLNIWTVEVQTHHYICRFLIIIKYSNKVLSACHICVQECKHIETGEGGEYRHYITPTPQARLT
jgi:hypothetical protein